jgi:hypothetical protein
MQGILQISSKKMIGIQLVSEHLDDCSTYKNSHIADEMQTRFPNVNGG